MDNRMRQGKNAYLCASVSGMIGAAVFLLLILFLAFLALRIPSLQGREAHAGRILLALTALFVSLAATKQKAKGLVPLTAVSCGILLLLLMLWNMFMEDSSCINKAMLLNVISVLLGGLASCFLRAKKWGHRSRRH